MKGILSRAAVLVFCFLLAGGGRANALEMVEGDWEIVSETSITMGTMSMPGMTSKSTHCLTREDPVPAAEQDKDCKMVDHKVVGNKVSWRIVCKDGEGEGEITYAGSGRSYAGTFRMKTAAAAEAPKKRTEKSGAKAQQKKAAEDGGDGETAMMTMKLAGRYLGPCPKGQKSGATGETAARQAQAEQAMAQAKQQQAEAEALRQKCEEFVKRTAVPAEDPNACAQEGFAKTPDCEQKVGSLNLQYGLYEITVERADRSGQFCSKKEEKRKAGEKPATVCLNGDNPVPPELRTGRQVRKVKRGKDKITWEESYQGGVTRGGVVYRGTSFEGVTIQKGSAGPGMEQLQVTKVTGRRVGDGDCPKESTGREYTSRARSGAATPQTQTPDTPPTGKEKPPDDGKGTGEINPVKEIRKLFKF